MGDGHAGAGRATELPGLAALPVPPRVLDLLSCPGPCAVAAGGAKKHRGAVEIPSKLVRVTAVTCTVVLPAALSHLSKHLRSPWPRKERWLRYVWGFPAEPGDAFFSLAQGGLDRARAASPLLGAVWRCCSFLLKETAEWVLRLVGVRRSWEDPAKPELPGCSASVLCWPEVPETPPQQSLRARFQTLGEIQLHNPQHRGLCRFLSANPCAPLPGHRGE